MMSDSTSFGGMRVEDLDLEVQGDAPETRSPQLSER